MAHVFRIVTFDAEHARRSGLGNAKFDTGEGRTDPRSRRAWRHSPAFPARSLRATEPHAMRVITLNVNGIRSADRRGLARWLGRIEPWDVVCLQELRAHESDVPRALRAPGKRRAAFHRRSRKGYAGVGLTQQGRDVRDRLRQPRTDGEGRYLQADSRSCRCGRCTCLPARAVRTGWPPNSAFSISFLPHLERLRRAQREIILCGDWNIAHQPIDLTNWRSNQKHSGFLPEERRVADALLDELEFVDVFRHVDPRPEQYTWWCGTAATRGRRTWAGGSTTRSRHRASPRRRARRQSTRTGAFRTTRR